MMGSKLSVFMGMLLENCKENSFTVPGNDKNLCITPSEKKIRKKKRQTLADKVLVVALGNCQNHW